MAMIALVSAAGSPGVTTTAVGLGLTSSRPALIVEADPTGGSAVLAGFFRGGSEHTGGLLDLVWAQRDGRLAEELPRSLVPFPDSSASLLPGVRSHAQSRNVSGIWEPLTATLKGLRGTGQDVIVDAGRLGLTDAPEPLVYAADVTLLVLRSDLVSVSAARSWADTLRSGFDRIGGLDRLGVLLVGDGRPYKAGEVGSVLGLPVVASMAWNEAAAAVFSRGARPPRRFTTSGYLGSLGAAWAAIDRTVTAADNMVVAATAGAGQ